MKPIILSFLLIAGVTAQAQVKISVGPTRPDGFAIVTKKEVTQWSTTTKTYGLLHVATKDTVLPCDYQNMFYTNDAGLYITQKSYDKNGLYSAPDRKFLLPPEYTTIESQYGYKGLYRVRKPDASNNDKWGYANIKGEFVIPLQYAYLGDLNQGLICFSNDNKKYGFINLQNEVVLPAQYAYATSFYNGLAVVALEKGGKYGAVNKKGKTVIPYAYDGLSGFYKNYASVYKVDNKTGSKLYGAIDPKNKLVLPMQYDNVIPEGQGLFTVQKNINYGIMDSTGTTVMPIEMPVQPKYADGVIIVSAKDKRQGIIDNKGKWIVKPEYDYISSARHQKDLFYGQLPGKTIRVLDRTGKTVIERKNVQTQIIGKTKILFVGTDKAEVFDLQGKLLKTFAQVTINPFITTFTDKEDSLIIGYGSTIQHINLITGEKQMLDVTRADNITDDGIFLAQNSKGYFFYDYTGKQLNDSAYAVATRFSDGRAVIQKKKNEAPALINRNFQIVKKADYLQYYSGYFSEGIARIKSPIFGYPSLFDISYIDKQGKELFKIERLEGAGDCIGGVIRMKVVGEYCFVKPNGEYIDIGGKYVSGFDDAGDFSEGLARAKYLKWGYVDTAMKKVIDYLYDDVTDFSKGAALVRQNNQLFLIDKQGNRIDQNNYQGYNGSKDGYFAVKKNGKFGIIDNKGKQVIPFEYDICIPPSEGLAFVKKNGKVGAVNFSNKTVVPFEYDNADVFKNGYARVIKAGKYGLVDKTGKLVLPPEYKGISDVYKGNVVTETADGTRTVSLK